MAQTPAGTVENISIGGGIIYLGDAGATPVADQGYLSADGITFTYETEIVEVAVGFPEVTVRQFVRSITATLSFTSIEWKFDLINRSLQGTQTLTATDDELLVGVNACPSEVALRAQFCMPCEDDTITIDIWRAQSDGAFEVQLANDNPHSMGYAFKVLLATEKWDGSPLTAKEGLFRLHREFN